MKRNILILFVIVFGFLSVNISHVSASTFYFDGAVNHNWNTLGNWWTDVGFTSPAGSLPGVGDDVVLSNYINVNSGPSALVNTVTLNGASYINIIPVTATSGFTFHDSSFHYLGTITGDATFYDSSYNINGPIIGNATFHDSSYNQNIIQGDATFYDHNKNLGTVTGDATFLDVVGTTTITFTGSNFWAKVLGTARNASGDPIVLYDFYDSSYNNYLTPLFGDAVFHDSSYNHGDISGMATFNDLSFNQGTVAGNAIYNYAHGGVITVAEGGLWGGGTAGANLGNDIAPITSWIFNGDSYNAGEVTGDAIFNGTSHNDTYVSGKSIFNDSSYNVDSVEDATFNDSSFNNDGIVYGDASFKDTSENNGEVDGDACFAKTATNNGTVGGKITVCGAHRQSSGSSAAAISNFLANNKAPSVSAPSVVTTQPLVFHFVKNIKINTNDTDVQNLQKYLNSHGFIVSLTGPGSLGNETTFFGLKTKAALILFQKSKGLVPDGIVGPKTLAMLQ